MSRTTIIMSVVALLGLTAMILTIRSDLASSRRATAGPRPLFEAGALPVDQVSRIELVREGGEPLLFEREEQRWRQVRPFEHPMDAFSVRQLAVLAGRLEIVDEIAGADATAARSPLMLDPPAGSIRYEWDGGSAELTLGRRGIAGRAYLRKQDDQTVYVVNQDLHDRALDMDPKEWRERRLFRHASIESGRIDRADGDVLLSLERHGRRWRMTSPVATRADPVAMTNLAEALGKVQAAEFVLDQPENPAVFGLLEPVATFSVTTIVPSTRGETVERTPLVERLLIGTRIGGAQDRFAMVEGRPTVVRLPASAVAALFQPVTTLIDPTGSGVVPADVKSIQIVTSSDTLTLERNLERWIAPEYGGADVPVDRVDQLLATLTELRAPRVIVQEYPRDLELAVVTLYGFDGRPKDTVRIVRDPGTGETALENGDNVLRAFPAATALPLTARDFGLQG